MDLEECCLIFQAVGGVDPLPKGLDLVIGFGISAPGFGNTCVIVLHEHCEIGVDVE